MKTSNNFIFATIIAMALLIGIGATSRLVAADELCFLPEDEIHSATLSLCVWQASGETLNVHRITDAWLESTVTWDNFAGGYDATVLNSFTGSLGCQAVDVTDLVQAWIDGAYDNYGMLLEQVVAPPNTWMWSSEYVDDPSLRPSLEICLTESDCVTIQRPGAEQDGVADAYIWENYPTTNNGASINLDTGNFQDKQKQTLVRFEIPTCPPPGTGTPGYWKNHPGAWPVDEITIGCETYTKDEAIEIMQMPKDGDRSLIMFFHLVAAKLNVLIGNPDSCIAETITAADAWLCAYPLESGEYHWHGGRELKNTLDAYNNGLLCAPHRD